MYWYVEVPYDARTVPYRYVAGLGYLRCHFDLLLHCTLQGGYGANTVFYIVGCP